MTIAPTGTGGVGGAVLTRLGGSHLVIGRPPISCAEILSANPESYARRGAR